MILKQLKVFGQFVICRRFGVVSAVVNAAVRRKLILADFRQDRNLSIFFENLFGLIRVFSVFGRFLVVVLMNFFQEQIASERKVAFYWAVHLRSNKYLLKKIKACVAR